HGRRIEGGEVHAVLWSVPSLDRAAETVERRVEEHEFPPLDRPEKVTELAERHLPRRPPRLVEQEHRLAVRGSRPAPREVEDDVVALASPGEVRCDRRAYLRDGRMVVEERHDVT